MTGLQKISKLKPKCFWGPGDTIGQKELKNKKKVIRFGHTEALLLKKGPHFGQNSRPGESDPYMMWGFTPSQKATVGNVKQPHMDKQAMPDLKKNLLASDE